MNGLSVKKKLFLAFGSILIIMAILGVYASFSINKVNDKSTQISQTWVPSITANNQMIDAVNAHKVALYRHVTSPNQAAMSKNEEALKKADLMMQEAIKKYENLTNTAVYSSAESRQKDLDEIKKIETQWNAIHKDSNEVLQLSRQHKMAESLALMNTKAPAVLKLESESLRPMLEFNVTGVNRLSNEAQEVYERADKNSIPG